MLFAVLVVLFLATFIRSAFGFGEALVAVPLLAFVMPVEVAAPIAVLVSITVALVAIVRDLRHIHFRSVGWLFLATAVGTPLGLLMLHRLDSQVVKAVLGVVILVFSIWALIGRRQTAFADERHAWLFGFAAGVLGGAYGMIGPPLVMYGALRGWSPERFRATLQGYFLPASLLALCGYGLTGLWTPTVTRWYLLALPVVVAGIVAGRLVGGRISARRWFTLCIHAGLVMVGAVLLLQSLGWIAG
ncbi:MAG: sulfite exporter TauE/SafE family protein [Rhodanobacteraceae bacterium]